MKNLFDNNQNGGDKSRKGKLSTKNDKELSVEKQSKKGHKELKNIPLKG